MTPILNRFPLISRPAAIAGLAGAGLLMLLLLGGCGSDKKSSTKSAGKSASGTTATVAADAASTNTTGEAASPDDVTAGQLDFFTERYISADERLQRRQQRIESVLQNPAAPAPQS